MLNSAVMSISFPQALIQTSIRPLFTQLLIAFFEQLGLLDEINNVSFPRRSMDIYKEDLTLISSMLQGELKEKYVQYSTHNAHLSLSRT